MKLSMLQEDVENKTREAAKLNEQIEARLSDAGYSGSSSQKLPSLSSFDNMIDEKEEATKEVQMQLDDKRLVVILGEFGGGCLVCSRDTAVLVDFGRLESFWCGFFLVFLQLLEKEAEKLGKLRDFKSVFSEFF